MCKKIPIGIDSFKELIENDYYYIDKTDLIVDVLSKGAKVNLFPRPRRFGKTLAMSMVDEYFNIKKKEDNKNLFKGLNIEKASDEIKKQQGKYPVIFMSLKGIKDLSWENEYSSLKGLISGIYRQNAEVIEILEDEEKTYYKAILEKEADASEFKMSIKNLCTYLERYYGEKVVVLIDEYDAPIEASFLHGFYDECISFMRDFFGEALKTNEALKFSCMTGILKISKESIFSGLNNLKVYSILDEGYSEYFGFLENEVEEMLNKYNLNNMKQDIKLWYNGYTFGNHKIYNPWSILNAVSDKRIQAYWANTGGIGLIQNMFEKSSLDIKENIKTLLEGKSVTIKVDSNMVYSDITRNKESIYMFLLLTGYLTFENYRLEGITHYADIRIPNAEIQIEFRRIVDRWFEVTDTVQVLENFHKSILDVDLERANYYLNDILLKSASFYDTMENFYHGFMLGIFVGLTDKYIVTSNREAGLGRYDMQIEKRDGSVRIYFRI